MNERRMKCVLRTRPHMLRQISNERKPHAKLGGEETKKSNRCDTHTHTHNAPFDRGQCRVVSVSRPFWENLSALHSSVPRENRRRIVITPSLIYSMRLPYATAKAIKAMLIHINTPYGTIFWVLKRNDVYLPVCPLPISLFIYLSNLTCP